MELNKQNDIFVASVLTPDINVFDLQKSNILPDNTSFFDKDTYKNSDFVKKTFVDDKGNFDDLAFNKAYENASKIYTEMSNDKFLKNNLEWDAYDFMRPLDSKTKTAYGEITKDINPYQNLYGRTSLHSVTPGKLTVRELAQQSKVFDYKKGEFTDKSANDLGLFGTMFNDTLVYAQWEEEGMHKDYVTGREVKHKKGDFKLNQEGNFYTETLGGREVYGKQIVNPTDVITTDGSYFNKLDYFDSDGKDKSVVGTVFKVATQIAPFFIPGVAVPYGTLKMAVGLSEALPTFYKAMEGIILGDTSKGNETDLWKTASKLEGFMAKYNAQSFSDKGSESMWNFEQLSQMVASTFSQVYEQRAAANLSKLFYKTNNPEYLTKLAGKAELEVQKAALSGAITSEKMGERVGKAAYDKLMDISQKSLKQSGIAKSLSLGYMALTSTADIYHEALAGGYDRRTAGVSALLAAGGQYAIMMNNRMADWFLDDAVGFNVEKNRSAMRKVLKENMGLIDENVKKMQINKLEGKKGLAAVITKAKQSINNIIVEPLSSSSVTEQIYKNSIVEGVEEVTEQMVLDATKGIVDTMSWLGLTKNQGSFNTVQNVFSGKGLENYLSNFVGGLLGGGIFELNRLKIEPMITGKSIDDKTNYSLIRMVANGQTADLKAEVDSMVKSMGNNYLDPLGVEENGTKMYIGTDKMSQAQLIGEATKSYIDYLDKLMSSEGLKIDDETVIKKAILNEIIASDLEKTGIDKFILSDFNNLTKDIIDTKTKLSQLTETEEDKKAELTAKLRNSKDALNELINGQKAGYYKNLSLFSLNKTLHSPFISLDVYDYTKKTYNQDYNSLPQSTGTLTKDMIDAEFKEIMDNDANKKNKLKFMYSVFQDLVERYGDPIAQYSVEKNIKVRDRYLNIISNSDLLTKEALISNQAAVKGAEIKNYDLSEILNMPLGDILIDNNYLDITGLSPEEVESVKARVNSLSLQYNQINPALLSSLFRGVYNLDISNLDKEVAAEATKTGESVEDVKARYADKYKEIERLAPKMKNGESKEELPLDIIYLTNELANDEDLTFEVADRIKRKTQAELSAKKELIDDIDSSKNNFMWYDEGEDDYIELDIADEAVQKINEFKARLSSAKTLEEYDTTIKELDIFLSSFENSPVGLNIENIRSMLPKSSDLFVKAERLLQKNIMDNKLYDLLNSINVDIFTTNGSVNVNILELLKTEISALQGLDSVEDYVRSTDTINSLKRAISAVQLAKAISTGMLQIDDDIVNVYGFTNNLRETQKIGEKVSEVAPMQTLDYEAYAMLNQELSILEGKLNYLVELSESNKSTIAAEQENIKNINSTLFVKALTDPNSKVSIQNFKFKGEQLLKDNEVSEILGKYNTDEEKYINLAEALYLKFNKLYAEFGEDVLDEIFSVFKTDDFKKSLDSFDDPGLTKFNTEINSVDYFKELHTIFAVNVKEFFVGYKNLLEKEVSLQTDQKAPFYAQEVDLRTIYAYRANKKVMAHTMTFLKEISGENRIFLNNALIITGSGGVGKTTVISNFAVRLEKDSKTDILVTAPSEEQIDKLKKDISRGENLNITSIKKSELLIKILGSYHQNLMDAITNLENSFEKLADNTTIKDNGGNDVIQIKNKGNYEITLHPSFLEKLAFNLSGDNDTVIYIDEVSWFNPLELEALSHISGIDGSRLYVIGLGDELQRGYSIKGNPFSLDGIIYNGPPKLKGVIRADNESKKDNITAVEKNLKVKLTNLYRTGKGFTLMDDSIPTSISFSEKGFLKGDKFVSKLGVTDLLKLDPTKEIVAITDNGTLSPEEEQIFKDANLLDKIKILSVKNIQGKEFSQVVSLVKIPYDTKDLLSKYNAYKYLYTLLSRGKTSSLIVGNNNLASDLGIENIHKDFSADVELQEHKIAELLEKRVNTITGIIKDFSPEESAKEEIIEEEKEVDVYKTDPVIVDNLPEVDKKEELSKVSTPDHDGDNKYLMYSFYNNINATIDNSTLNINSKIEFGKAFDLQILNHAIAETAYSNLTPEQVVNEFIIAKNHILHGLTVPDGNLFVKALSNFTEATGKFVIRKVVMDKNNLPYGKQAHKLDPNGEERMPEIGKTYYFLAMKADVFNSFGGDKIDGYVTLAALPDVNNEAWRKLQPKNLANLTEIYAQVEANNEVEIDINKTVLTGINLVYADGTSKPPTKAENVIHIGEETPQLFEEKLMELFPGIQVSNLSQIQVFDDNEEAIIEEFKKTGYDLGPRKDLKNVKALRFRPYIKVSYIDPRKNEVSKILMLNPKSRSLAQAKSEYEETKNRFRALGEKGKELRNFINTEFPVLISKYKGWELFFDLLNYFEAGDPNKVGDTGLSKRSNDLISKIIKLEIDSSENEAGLDTFTVWSKVITEILPACKNSKGKFDLSLIAKQDKNVLLGKPADLSRLLGKPSDQTRVGNIGLRILDALTHDEIEEFSSNWDRTGTDYKPIYYNALWKSKHSQEAGVVMDGSFIKYFELNCFVEPPIFLSGITIKSINPSLNEPATTTVEEKSTSEGATDTLSNIFKAKTVINPVKRNTFLNNKAVETNGIINVNFAAWAKANKTEDQVHKAVASIYSALHNLKTFRPTSAENIDLINRIAGINDVIAEEILANPAFIKNNNNLDISIANIVYNKILDMNEDLYDIFKDLNLEMEDYLLSGVNIKSLDDKIQNKELNSTICK